MKAHLFQDPKLVEMARVAHDLRAEMGYTTFTEEKMHNAFGQYNTATLTGPANHFFGLGTATTWLASTSYSLGAYVIPTTFNSLNGQAGKIFKCTTAGESSGTQPTWPTTPGGTVVDGGVTWTEVSNLFQAGTFTGLELTVGVSGYARVEIAGNATNFPNASAAQPSVISNGVAINFPSPTADWGLAVAWIDFDASTGGNAWAWGVNATAIDCASGSSPSFAIAALTLSLTP